MARTAAELVAALDSGEPSRVLRTPEGQYSTQVLAFCKELWGVDPMAQSPEVKAAIDALPHPSHWDDEAAVRQTITQWLSVLSLAATQFGKDALGWKDKTHPPVTHKVRPWINSFRYPSLPDQVPVPFTMGTETWHRSAPSGVRVVAGEDWPSLALHPIPAPRAWRVATTLRLREAGIEGFKGYGIRTPFAGAPTHLLTLDRLYGHLLYCVMDCPPPGYEPTPLAQWRGVPVTLKDPEAALGITVTCSSKGAVGDWSVKYPPLSTPIGTSKQGTFPGNPIPEKRYIVGDKVGVWATPPNGEWGPASKTLTLTIDGKTWEVKYEAPEAQWMAQGSTASSSEQALMVTFTCTEAGYIATGVQVNVSDSYAVNRDPTYPQVAKYYKVGDVVRVFAFRKAGKPKGSPGTMTATLRGATGESKYTPPPAQFSLVSSSADETGATWTVRATSAGATPTAQLSNTPSVLGLTRYTPLWPHGEWVSVGQEFSFEYRPVGGTPVSQPYTAKLTIGTQTPFEVSWAGAVATFRVDDTKTTDRYVEFWGAISKAGRVPDTVTIRPSDTSRGSFPVAWARPGITPGAHVELGTLGVLRGEWPAALTKKVDYEMVWGSKVIGQATFTPAPAGPATFEHVRTEANDRAIHLYFRATQAGSMPSYGWSQTDNANSNVTTQPTGLRANQGHFSVGDTLTFSCTWNSAATGDRFFAVRLDTTTYRGEYTQQEAVVSASTSGDTGTYTVTTTGRLTQVKTGVILSAGGPINWHTSPRGLPSDIVEGAIVQAGRTFTLTRPSGVAPQMTAVFSINFARIEL